MPNKELDAAFLAILQETEKAIKTNDAPTLNRVSLFLRGLTETIDIHYCQIMNDPTHDYHKQNLNHE